MLADFALLLCALFWGLSFPAMKILVNIYPSCWLLFLRFTAGSCLIFLFFHKRILKNWRHDLLGGIIIGVTLFAAIVSQTVALNFMDAGRNAFITAIYVLLVPLMLWVSRKIFPGWLTLGAACLCVIGMFFMTNDLNGSFNIGDFLTILCAIFFSWQILAISYYTNGCDPIVLSFIEFVIIAILSFISSLIFETPVGIKIDSISELLFTIVFCTFGCYMVQICAQKYSKPSHAAIIMSLESVFGLFSSIIFLGEIISFRMAIGCVLIFVSVMIAELEPFI